MNKYHLLLVFSFTCITSYIHTMEKALEETLALSTRIDTAPLRNFQTSTFTENDFKEMQADFQFLLQPSQKSNPGKLRSFAAGFAIALIARTVYDTYQKVSQHEKWNNISRQKQAKLIATHTVKSMTARPIQLADSVKNKLQEKHSLVTI